MSTPQREIRRLNLDLSPEHLALIDECAERIDASTRVETIRKAIRLLHRVTENKDTSLILRDKSGKEVTLLLV